MACSASALSRSSRSASARCCAPRRRKLRGRPGKNVLWDCISLIDGAAMRVVEALGGLSAIAISHPHYYSSMVEWSRASGGAPIYLHADDRHWVMRPDPAIVFWEGDTLDSARPDAAAPGRAFRGRAGAALGWGRRWSRRAPRRRHPPGRAGPPLRELHVQLPQYTPLPAATVRRMLALLEPYAFEQVYGAWFGAVVRAPKEAVRRSAERHPRPRGRSIVELPRSAAAAGFGARSNTG